MPLILKLWQAVPSSLQLSIVKTVQRNKRIYRWLMFRHADLKDRSNGKRSCLPPAELRYRVGASPDLEEFITIGSACANDIQSTLQNVGRDIGSFQHILDFGCGCGRTLIHMQNLAPHAQFDGADSVFHADSEIGAAETVRVLRVGRPGIPVVRDVAGVGDRHLDLRGQATARKLDMHELATVEKAHQGQLVFRDVVPFDPVRDAAHARTEVPAVDHEGHAEVHGQANAL